MVNCVLKELKKINYKKFVSIEIKNPGDNKLNLITKSIKTVIKAKKLI